ncbi:MAG TPA: hypothetical protein VF774_13000 [Pseudoduganella sp.]|jgi:hypothetical protein
MTVCRSILVLFAGLVLAGCANFRLHSPAREAQGDALKTAWEKARDTSDVAVARNNLAALATAQQEATARLQVARLEATISGLARSGTVRGALEQPIAAQLTRLAGSPEAARKLNSSVMLRETAERRVRTMQDRLRDAGFEAPDCVALEKPGAAEALADLSKANAAAGTTAAKLATLCKSPALKLSLTEDLDKNSALATAIGRLQGARDKLVTEQQQTVVARLSYQAAARTYELAASSPEGTAGADSKAALEKLRRAFELLDKAPDAYTQAFLSEARRDAIDGFFTAALDTKPGDPLPEGAGNAAAFYVLYRDEFDRIRGELAAARLPRLQPLLLKREYENVHAVAGEREVALTLREIEVLEQGRALRYDQLRALLRARNELARANATKCWPADATLRAALVPARKDTEGCREARGALVEAAGFYLDATARIEAAIVNTDNGLGMLRRERALIYAEANVNQWAVLIDSGVDQLHQYGENGVKAEQLLAILNAVTLIWIGKGVN